MYNKIVLVGNLTKDVEIKYSQSGSAIGNVGIAVNRKWKSQTGEQKEEVMFIDLTFFGRTAEIANQYLYKGSKVLVDGRLVFQQWTAQDGSKRSKHAVTVENLQMLDSKADSMNPNNTNGYGEQPSQNNYGGQNQGGYGNNNNASGGYDNSGYNAPQQQNYGQPQVSQQRPTPIQRPTQPSSQGININNNEIPF